MTASALFTFIATILTVAPGIVEIDFGSAGGLRAGDTGVIFYEFGVRDQVESVEIGPASVVEISPHSAKLQIAPSLRVRSGFLVRFELPRSRLAGRRAESAEPNRATSIAYVANTGNTCLRLRSRPATDAETLACLPEGTAVTIIGTIADWQRARIADGRAGWLASRFLAEPGQITAAARTDDGRFEVEIHDLESHSDRPAHGEPGAGLETAYAEPAYPESGFEDPSHGSRDLDEQLGQADTAVEELLGQISQNQAELDEVERTRTELSHRLLETTVTGLESRLARARADLEHTEKARVELARQLDSLVLDRRRLEERLEESLVNARNVEEQRKQLETELASTQSDLATSRTGLEQANTYRTSLEDALAAARADFAGIDAEREQLLLALESARSELAQVESTANTAQRVLTKEVEHTETELAALRSRLELREGELGRTETQLAAVEAERTALKAELDEFETGGKSDLKRQLNQAKADLREADREKKALEVWLGERGRELDQAEARVAIMQSEIDRLETVAPRDRREIEATRTALGEARRRAAELEDHLATSEEQAEVLQVKLSTAQRELAGHRGRPSPSGPQIQDISDERTTDAELVVMESAVPCLNFRAEPKLDSKIFDCLEPGSRLGALGHWEGWHYVELADGRAGWVSSQHLGSPATGGTGP